MSIARKGFAFRQGVLALAVATAFGLGTAPAFAQDADLGALSGQIVSDGSSTVGPLTQAVAEEFNAQAPNVQITVDISGTGGGFERFCAGETDVQNASRAIDEEEIALCAENGVEWYEFEVAYDGLTVVINKQNTWLHCLNTDALKLLWQKEAPATTWAELNADMPAETINLYGPGTDSGTFDFFVDTILGDADIREDFTPSEDDNVLVEGVAGDVNALGYFGLAYYEANTEVLTAVGIDNGDGNCVLPTAETVQDGTYAPLSRPLYVYVQGGFAGAAGSRGVHSLLPERVPRPVGRGRLRRLAGRDVHFRSREVRSGGGRQRHAGQCRGGDTGRVENHVAEAAQGLRCGSRGQARPREPPWSRSSWPATGPGEPTLRMQDMSDPSEVDRLNARAREALGSDADDVFVQNPGEMIAGTLVPAIGEGVAPLTVLGGQAPVALDLSGERSRGVSEKIVGFLLFVCGAISILTTVGIIVVLVEQAYEFFRAVPVTDFLFGTKWTALFKSPEYGVLPLVAGTLMVTLIAMIVAMPLGSDERHLPERIRAAARAGHPEARARVDRGHPDHRPWLLRPELHPARYPGAYLPEHPALQRAAGGARRRHHDDPACRVPQRRRDARRTAGAARRRLCAGRDQARGFLADRGPGGVLRNRRLVHPGHVPRRRGDDDRGSGRRRQAATDGEPAGADADDDRRSSSRFSPATWWWAARRICRSLRSACCCFSLRWP